MNRCLVPWAEEALRRCRLTQCKRLLQRALAASVWKVIEVHVATVQGSDSQTPYFCVRHAVVTGMNIISILYVVLAGSPFGQASNLSPFAPHGLPGIFAGAAIVYFSFVGFDLVATMAEEV